MARKRRRCQPVRLRDQFSVEDPLRIRTIKPEFFKHDALFDAEKETGFPIRIAFAGLWCASDREGRFKWRPRQLKVEILPYDDIDFSRVLDALATRGFVEKYTVKDEVFGVIPSFKRHQVINNKESASVLPQPPAKENVAREDHASSTREQRVDDAILKEGKGKEGKDTGGAAAGNGHWGQDPIGEWEIARGWLNDWLKNGADYTEFETRGAFLALQANGWRWGQNPIVDHRAALERQIQTDRGRKRLSPAKHVKRDVI